MVIRFAPNNNNNQKVVEEQAVWRGTNFLSRFPLSISKPQQLPICTVPQYPNVTLFHEGNLRPV